MNVVDLIIMGIEKEMGKLDRPAQREFNSFLTQAKWIVGYPYSTVTSEVYDSICFAFSNSTPEFVERGALDGVAISKYSMDYNVEYDCNWAQIAVHMEGTIWIETSRFKPVYIKPLSFDDIKDLPSLGREENVNLHSAVIQFLGCGEDYAVDEILEKHLASLPPEVLRLEIIFDDVEQRNWYEYGNRSVAIYYHNELIGYAKFSGRELLSQQFFTNDIKKYQNAMKDIVDKSGIYDKMVYNGVKVVGDEDADIHIGIPGYTPKSYSGG